VRQAVQKVEELSDCVPGQIDREYT